MSALKPLFEITAADFSKSTDNGIPAAVYPLDFDILKAHQGDDFVLPDSSTTSRGFPKSPAYLEVPLDNRNSGYFDTSVHFNAIFESSTVTLSKDDPAGAIIRSLEESLASGDISCSLEGDNELIFNLPSEPVSMSLEEGALLMEDPSEISGAANDIHQNPHASQDMSHPFAAPDTISSVEEAASAPRTFSTAITLPEDVIGIVRVVKQGKYGEIVEGKSGEWIYKLYSPVDSTEIADLPEADTVYVIVEDKWHNKVRAPIKVNIIEDVPEAAKDAADIGEGTAFVSGNVLLNDIFGADDRAAENGLVWDCLVMNNGELRPVTGVSLRGEWGTFAFNDDGSWMYELDRENPDILAMKGAYTDEDGVFHEAERKTETIRYTITDADGDSHSAELVLTITGQSGDITIIPNDPDPDVPGEPGALNSHGASVTAYEKNLPEGSEPDGDGLILTGKIAIAADDGVKKIMLGDVEIRLDGSDALIPNDYGVLTVRYVGGLVSGYLEYEFILSAETAHSQAGADLVFEAHPARAYF